MNIINISGVLALLLLTYCIHPALAQEQLYSFEECLKLALEKNLALQRSELATSSAGISYARTKNQRYPNLTMGGYQSWSFGRSGDPLSYQFVNETISNTNFSVNSLVTLFDSFGTTNEIRQAKADLQSAEKDYEYQKNQVALSVASACLQLLLAYESEESVRSQISVFDQQLRDTEKLVQQGVRTESDYLQVKSQLATLAVQLKQAENTVVQAKLNLTQLMELPFSYNFEIEQLDITGISSDWDETSAELIYKQALHVLPEIESVRFDEQAAKYGLGIAKSYYYPTITLGGGLSTGYSSSRELTSVEATVTEEPIGYLASNPGETVIGTITETTAIARNYPFGRQFEDNFSQSINLNLSIPIYNRGQPRLSTQQA